MYPLARVTIRRHFVEPTLDKDGNYRTRHLRLFRVVGGPAPRALRCLEKEIEAGGRCCVGVTTEGAAELSDASIKVLQTVLDFCELKGLPMFLCGIDEPTLSCLFPEDSPMRPKYKAFDTVQDLIAIFCDHGVRGQAGSAHH